MFEGAVPSTSSPSVAPDAVPDGPATLAQEIGELGRMLAQVKRDLASIQSDEVGGCHIPAAHAELHAIVAQTEAATNEILDACEAMAGLDGTSAARIQAAATRIYEACGFQDIIGQRINKVMSTLKIIDMKVERIIAAFGEVAIPVAIDPTGQTARPQPEADPAARLMNGPQLPKLAMGQSEIDRLLAGG